MKRTIINAVTCSCLLACAFVLAQTPRQSKVLSPATPASRSTAAASASYVLGPGDQITVWALGVPEITDKPIQIDPGGWVDIPIAGHIMAAGLTSSQLRTELIKRLGAYVKTTEVAVNIATFRSQPVSVIGAVNKPGVHQLEGRKTIVEVLALAGGLRDDAGNTITITRRLESGRFNLPGETIDGSHQFRVVSIPISTIMDASKPADNILVLPFDVVSVPRASMIYVMGEVLKPGGYVLTERETYSVLQALSLAGGTTKLAATGRSKVLRQADGAPERQEIALDLKRVLAGKATDMPLRPEDILFVPSNTAKAVSLKTIETLVGIGSGVIIWRR